jgi:hypothetical protein
MKISMGQRLFSESAHAARGSSNTMRRVFQRVFRAQQLTTRILRSASGLSARHSPSLRWQASFFIQPDDGGSRHEIGRWRPTCAITTFFGPYPAGSRLTFAGALIDGDRAAGMRGRRTAAGDCRHGELKLAHSAFRAAA